MDEARFGLHTLLRKLWTLRGVRPIVSCQTRYEWDYLYGALEVTQGEAHFCQIGTVNLDCDRLSSRLALVKSGSRLPQSKGSRRERAANAEADSSNNQFNQWFPTDSRVSALSEHALPSCAGTDR
jgi:hypothetical protein